MNMLQVSVIFKNTIWDQFIIFNDNVMFYKRNDTQKTIPTQLQQIQPIVSNKLCENDTKVSVRSTLKSNGKELLEKVNKLDISSRGKCTGVNRQRQYTPELHISGYFLSLFVRTLQQSVFYRKLVLARFQKLLHESGPLKLNIILVEPHKDIIDFAWGKRMEKLALERRELDMAMSWLSTLGGAFSALGEEFQHCAEIAGRISVHQFSIALRLGDPLTVARCKLYLALSLIQRGHLAAARHIIQQQYCLAREAPVVDTRLVAMCKGIWARLKYEHHKRKSCRYKI